jgi:hypothetical protein
MECISVEAPLRSAPSTVHMLCSSVHLRFLRRAMQPRGIPDSDILHQSPLTADPQRTENDNARIDGHQVLRIHVRVGTEEALCCETWHQRPRALPLISAHFFLQVALPKWYEPPRSEMKSAIFFQGTFCSRWPASKARPSFSRRFSSSTTAAFSNSTCYTNQYTSSPEMRLNNLHPSPSISACGRVDSSVSPATGSGPSTWTRLRGSSGWREFACM